MALTVTALGFFTQIAKFEVANLADGTGAGSQTVPNATILANMAGPMRDFWAASYATQVLARAALMTSKDMTVLIVGRDGTSYWRADVDVDINNKPTLHLQDFAGAAPADSSAILTIMHNTGGW